MLNHRPAKTARVPLLLCSSFVRQLSHLAAFSARLAAIVNSVWTTDKDGLQASGLHRMLTAL